MQQQSEHEEPVKKAPEIIPKTPDLDAAEVAELEKLVCFCFCFCFLLAFLSFGDLV